jgi:hypothetical protein
MGLMFQADGLGLGHDQRKKKKIKGLETFIVYRADTVNTY